MSTPREKHCFGFSQDSMPPGIPLAGLLLVLAGGLTALAAPPSPPDGNPRTAYFTTGDTQDLLDTPVLDSQATIATAFETLRQKYAVERIWWRGGQDEVWGEEFEIRPENRGFARVWDWWRDLQYRKVGTNRIAVAEARKQQMQIWLTYGLFDNGSQAEAGYSGFPYAVEDKLRISHPEWAPVNRWGTWRQGGPIEFAYPQARQAMADYLTRYVLTGGYDGIAFLTYAENFSQRYDDEFGYSDPIVAEFQAKYGQNIRQEAFDRTAWRRLRGSHVTEFLKLLKKQLGDRKIAVCVHGEQPDRAMKWNVDGGVWTAGNFSWSVDEWLQGEVVDEICLFHPAKDSVRQELVSRSQQAGRGVTISAFRTRGDLEPGIPRVMFLGREIEGGYDNEAWVDWPDEQLAEEPVSRLASGDSFARRRVLMRALKGKTTLTPAQLSRAIADPDVYVRRTALRTVARHVVDQAAPAVFRALNDPENSVRCQAALAAGELHATGAVEALLTAAFQPESTFQFHSRAVAEALKKMTADGRLGTGEKQLLVKRLGDSSSRSRELALYYFTLIGAPATPEVEAQLTRIALHDENPYARELAIVNLRSSFGATASVTSVLRQIMEEDRDHAVEVRATIAYAQMHARLEPAAAGRQESLEIVGRYFRRYGDGCQRTDRDWGWRPLGNAILEYGPAGTELLESLMREVDDRTLSDRAWRILHLKQGDQFFPVTEEEDAAAHRLHPWLKIP